MIHEPSAFETLFGGAISAHGVSHVSNDQTILAEDSDEDDAFMSRLQTIDTCLETEICDSSEEEKATKVEKRNISIGEGVWLAIQRGQANNPQLYEMSKEESSLSHESLLKPAPPGGFRGLREIDVNLLKKKAAPTVNDSFDTYSPKVKHEITGYKYKTKTVRGRAARKHLTGYTCHDCAPFYEAFNPEEKVRLVQKCSRHRALHVPNETTSPQIPWQMTLPGDGTQMKTEDVTPFEREKGKGRVKGPLRLRF